MNILDHHNDPAESCPAERLARELNALAHPSRILILRYLTQANGCCCKDVVGQFDLAQSTVSQHLKILVDAGFLLMQQDGQRSRYVVNREALQSLATAVNGFVASAVACCQDNEDQL